MGMSIFELQEITVRSLFNKLHGFKVASQEKWEQIRLQCYYAFSPIDPLDPEHKRMMPINSFMPFTWENVQVQNSLEELRKLAAEQKAAVAKKWKVD